MTLKCLVFFFVYSREKRKSLLFYTRLKFITQVSQLFNFCKSFFFLCNSLIQFFDFYLFHWLLFISFLGMKHILLIAGLGNQVIHITDVKVSLIRACNFASPSSICMIRVSVKV